MNRARVFLGVCVALSIAGNAVAQQIVSVGIVSATSGPLAEAGKSQLSGFKLAAKELKKAGGFTVGGKKYVIDLKIHDTRCGVDEGSAAIRNLVRRDRVPVVLGEVCDSAAVAEAAAARQLEVPIVFTAPTLDGLTTEENSWVFRINAPARQLNSVMAKFIAERRWSPLAFLARDDALGRKRVARIKDVLPGGIRRGHVGYFDAAAPDFAPLIAKLRSTGAAAVMLLTDAKFGGKAIKQIQAAGLDLRIIGSPENGGDQSAGMVRIITFAPEAEIPAVRNFDTRYRAEFNQSPDGYAAASYDGLFVVVDAMRRAGSVADAEAIRDALAKTRLNGVTGPIRFDETGQSAPTVYVTGQCEKSGRRILAPAHIAGSCGGG